MMPERESETIEFKKSISEMDEGVISLSSMLNKSGNGTLYFGVRNNGDVVGQEIGSMTTRKVLNAVRTHISPEVAPSLSVIEIEGKPVIKVQVAGDDAPYCSFGKYYLRQDDQDCSMSPSQLSLFFQNKRISYSDWEQVKTSYTVDDVDEELLISYIRKANAASRLEYIYQDSLNALTRLNLAVDGKLNNAGYHLFSDKKPLLLKLAVFATDEKLTFVDSKMFRGNIFECIETGIKYIASNIHFNARIVGVERVEQPEIPIEAIREIVVNSFVHMKVIDGIYNEISISPGTVRIYNPGTIALGADPKDFASGKIGSRVRNPLIATTLFKDKTVETFGTGFRRVFDLCDKQDIKYRYYNDQMGFVFEFSRKPSRMLYERQTEHVSDYFSPTEEALLEYARENGNILHSLNDAAIRLNKSYVSVQRYMNSLCEKGATYRVGSKKTGYWKIRTGNDRKME